MTNSSTKMTAMVTGMTSEYAAAPMAMTRGMSICSVA